MTHHTGERMPTHAHQSLWEANDENPGITENAHLSEVYPPLYLQTLSPFGFTGGHTLSGVHMRVNLPTVS